MKHYSPNGWEELPLEVPAEASVQLHVNGQEWVALQCLPENLHELAAGFLFNEGVIHTREEISLLDVCPDGTRIDAWLAGTVHWTSRPPQRRITSDCAGANASTGLESSLETLPLGAPISPQAVLEMAGDFITRTRHERTPGTHTSGLYAEGDPLLRVDIGRNNTLDRLAGACLLAGRSSAGMTLLTTGRISADMLQKAGRMGTPLVISLRSATSLAVTMAAQAGISLAAHARPTGFDLLYDPGRLSA